MNPRGIFLYIIYKLHNICIPFINYTISNRTVKITFVLKKNYYITININKNNDNYIIIINLIALYHIGRYN